MSDAKVRAAFEALKSVLGEDEGGGESYSMDDEKRGKADEVERCRKCGALDPLGR